MKTENTLVVAYNWGVWEQMGSNSDMYGLSLGRANTNVLKLDCAMVAQS